MRDLEETEEPTRSVKETIRQPSNLLKLARYFFTFWGVCVVAGAGTAVGLANAGMKVQDAFNSGLAVGLLPFIGAVILAFILMIFG